MFSHLAASHWIFSGCLEITTLPPGRVQPESLFHPLLLLQLPSPLFFSRSSQSAVTQHLQPDDDIRRDGMTPIISYCSLESSGKPCHDVPCACHNGWRAADAQRRHLTLFGQYYASDTSSNHVARAACASSVDEYRRDWLSVALSVSSI